MVKVTLPKPKKQEEPLKQPASEAPIVPDQDQTVKIFGSNAEDGPFTLMGPPLSNITSSSDTAYLSTSQSLTIPMSIQVLARIRPLCRPANQSYYPR